MPTRVAPPETLHLPRLARATPGRVLELPDAGGTLAVVHVDARLDGGSEDRRYVCLEGEVLLDLPHGAFVHLRTGETVRIPAGTPRTLTPVRAATLLVTLPDRVE